MALEWLFWSDVCQWIEFNRSGYSVNDSLNWTGLSVPSLYNTVNTTTSFACLFHDINWNKQYMYFVYK